MLTQQAVEIKVLGKTGNGGTRDCAANGPVAQHGAPLSARRAGGPLQAT
nr:hypothetical protein [Paraburkholderia youngii]